MKEPHEIPTFPLVGWDIGLLRSQARVLLRLLYLASPDDSDAHTALMHLLTPAEARELAQELVNQARLVEDWAR